MATKTEAVLIERLDNMKTQMSIGFSSVNERLDKINGKVATIDQRSVRTAQELKDYKKGETMFGVRTNRNIGVVLAVLAITISIISLVIKYGGN